MKRLFGFLLFIVGAVEVLLTIAAFIVFGFKTVFLVSVVIAVVLMAIGVILTYEDAEKALTEEELEAYRRNGSINERLGQL